MNCCPKNVSLIIFLLLLITQNISFPQWSTNPNNNLIVGYGLDPHICSDSAGGCYVTYNYGTLSYPQKLALERLDKFGYKPWGTLKQILGELPEQWQAEIIEDGEGGVIVSYQDNQVVGTNFTYRVRVQRVDSSGNFLWGQTGVRVTTTEINHGDQVIVCDGNGGCVVVWPNQLPNFTYEFRANRINGLGERVWGDTGIYIENRIESEPAQIVRGSDGHYYVKIRTNLYRLSQGGQITWQQGVTLGEPVADTEGGIVLSGRVGSINNRKIVAQRKDSLGNNLWQEPYVEIADSLYINTALSIKQNNGYFYYGWTGKSNSIDKVAQFHTLRLDGSKLFPDGSIQVGVPPLNGMIIQPLEENRTAFIYYNKDFLPDSLLVQTYDTLGNKLWIEEGILIAHPPIEYQSYTTDGNGGFIIGGAINNFTVVAQQVGRNGNLGEVIPVPVELISFTGVSDKDKVVLTWATATETNNSGFSVERKPVFSSHSSVGNDEWSSIGFVQGSGTTTDSKSYSFVDKDITADSYKYRLKQIDFDGTYKYSNQIEIVINNTPTEFALYQNYPNPFNSSTIIKYQVPQEGRVKLNLYNILGEKILTLIEGEQKEGEYQLNLLSDELPSGNYFYSLETISKRQIKKLTIIK